MASYYQQVLIFQITAITSIERMTKKAHRDTSVSQSVPYLLMQNLSLSLT